jgi:hypothetical protein
MGQGTEGKSEHALRVGIFLRGRLLEERFFEQPRAVYLGHNMRGNDIVVPSGALSERAKLFSRRGDKLSLHLPCGARGRLSRRTDGKAEVIDIGAIEGERTLPLDSRVRGKVVMGEVTVLFHFASPPAGVERPELPAEVRGGWLRDVHPVVAAALVLSAIVQIGFVGWTVSQDWPEALDDSLRVEDGFARLIHVAPPEPDEPDEPVDPETSADAEGPAADAPEQPTETAERAEPSSEPEPPPGPARMSDFDEEETVLGVLTSKGPDGESAIDQVIASANSRDADAAFANASRYRTGELGAGDLETSTGSRSGTGKAVGSASLGRSDSARRAEEGVDTGRVDEEAVECIGCRMDSEPEDISDPTAVPNPEAIADAISRIEGRIQSCYERSAKRDPSIGGKVVVTFTVVPRGNRGTFTDARPSVDSVGEGVGACVAREIGRLRLPIAPSGPIVVNKTFVFQQGQ